MRSPLKGAARRFASARRSLWSPNPLLGFASVPAVPIKKPPEGGLKMKHAFQASGEGKVRLRSPLKGAARRFASARRSLWSPNPLLGFASVPAVPIKKPPEGGLKMKHAFQRRVKGKFACAHPSRGPLAALRLRVTPFGRRTLFSGSLPYPLFQ